MGEKHYVYSARTTKDGLAGLNEARGERGWDSFVNEAVAGHYGLDLSVIAPPPSKFFAEREEKRKAREAELKPKTERPKKQPKPKAEKKAKAEAAARVEAKKKAKAANKQAETGE